MKNQTLVLRALQRLDEDVHLVLIGEGLHGARSRSWRRNCTLTDVYTSRGSWSRRRTCISSST